MTMSTTTISAMRRRETGGGAEGEEGEFEFMT
jgi:hypothetical protein